MLAGVHINFTHFPSPCARFGVPVTYGIPLKHKQVRMYYASRTDTTRARRARGQPADAAVYATASGGRTLNG